MQGMVSPNHYLDHLTHTNATHHKTSSALETGAAKVYKPPSVRHGAILKKKCSTQRVLHVRESAKRHGFNTVRVRLDPYDNAGKHSGVDDAIGLCTHPQSTTQMKWAPTSFFFFGFSGLFWC